MSSFCETKYTFAKIFPNLFPIVRIPSITAAVVPVVHVEDDVCIVLQMDASLVSLLHQTVKLKQSINQSEY